MKNEKGTGPQQQPKEPAPDSKDEKDETSMPPSDDPKECLRRLAMICSVLIDNPGKRENALKVINGNIAQLRRMAAKPDKKKDPAIALKMHETALSMIKRIEILEEKVRMQDKALSEEDLGSAIGDSIVDYREFENLKRDHESLKTEYDLILQKKGELSKELVEALEKLERATRELNIIKHEMEGAFVTKEQYTADVSVLEAKYSTDIAQNYVKREDQARIEADLKKMMDENAQLSAKVKELLNELESTREDAISDIKEWYILQLKKYRGTFDHLLAEKDSLSNLLKEEVEKRQKMELQLTEYNQKIERGYYLPKEKIDTELKRLTDATREAEDKRKEAEDLQARLKEDIVKLHMMEKDIQEKDAQIQWLKAKIGDDKIDHDSEIQEIEAEYNSRIKELERSFESKAGREKEVMLAEIERLKREMNSLLQTTRQQYK